MIPFELAEPTTLREAVDLLDPDDPSVRPVAGGTALMLMMKAGVFQPAKLISLQRVEPSFSNIAVSPDGELRVGAMASLSALETDRAVAEKFPVIARTLRTLSNVRVRNVARIGGALAHGDPHMDIPPVLSALGARVTTLGPGGARELPVLDLYAGYYETVLARNELISEVIVPPMRGRKAAYAKVTSRAADDWPALGIAVCLDAEAQTIRNLTIVVSAATEKVTRMNEAERQLRGAAADAATLKRAGEAAAEEAQVIADAHGSAAYKKELIRVYLGRAIKQALSNTPAH